MCFDVGHVEYVDLSHVYEQSCVVSVAEHGFDYVFRDVLGKGPTRACAAAVVASVVKDLCGEETEVESISAMPDGWRNLLDLTSALSLIVSSLT